MPDRQTVRFAIVPRVLRGAALVLSTLAAPLAEAAVEWHPDLDTAQAAARISHRPVLAVFVADWGAGARDCEATCLSSPEAEAVLVTCFEPVRVDIDAHPELTRSAGVTHVPTACVLAADATPLASFEMPDSPPAFVTAAILAAQRAATLADVPPLAEAAGSARAHGTPAPEPIILPAAAFGSANESTPVGGGQPRGSMARVTAKVRDLSAFAFNSKLPAPGPRPVTVADVSQGPGVAAPTTAVWPGEVAAAPSLAVAPAPTIEPATLTPTTVAPWLDTAPTAPALPPQPSPSGAASRPDAAATASGAAPLPSTSPPESPAPEQRSGLMAALQKPFGLAPKAPAEPPTMPPALPRGPFESQAAQPVPAVPAVPATAAADAAGSMPLGLEGYCPVTLVDRGSWAEGRAQWGARHRGRTYLFAGPDEQRTFLADPDRYAPALSGDDPVLALDRGSCTPGQRRYGVTYQARMYLFATPETRQTFSADPGRYATRILVAERTPAAASTTRTY